jgi:hypothetical protein
MEGHARKGSENLPVPINLVPSTDEKSKRLRSRITSPGNQDRLEKKLYKEKEAAVSGQPLLVTKILV